MNADLMVCLVFVLAVGGDKGVAGMVEDIEKAFMERKASAEDRGEHHFVSGDIDPGDT